MNPCLYIKRAVFLVMLVTLHATAIDIPYIKFTPVIDGQLDDNLSTLKSYAFEQYYDFGDPVEIPVKVNYRLAYNEKHLYVYIETDATKITYNKRGYLYGDGFKIVLGLLKNHQRSDEYYDLSYSPNTNNHWSQQFIATYNGRHINKPLSQLSQTKALAHDQGTGFETLIDWDDIHPINPIFDRNIGLNIYFAKSISAKDTLGYSITTDESIWDEGILDRNLTAVNFLPATQPIKAVQIHQRHYLTGEMGTITTLGLEESDSLTITVKNQQQKNMLSSRLSINSSNQRTIKIPQFKQLKSGLYDVNININDKNSYQTQIGIIDKPHFKNTIGKLINNNHHMSEGIVHTLIFHTKHLYQLKKTLKPYDTGDQFIEKWLFLNPLLNSFDAGKDPFAKLLGPYRRGFLSKIDGTYQPYTIKLPQDYNASKTYPLLVFLHGSGQDEQKLLNKERANGEFIELAPLGRDLFKAYSFDDSQKDIVEAINDVKKYFSVDEKRIVIGGFSMGGYGALRAFYSNPLLYQGVAIFAGHPDLANQWDIEGTHPNFLDPISTHSFKDIPVFIYHGTKDEAIGFHWAQQLKESLKKAGASVTYSFVENRGHIYQDENTHNLYKNWLNQF